MTCLGFIPRFIVRWGKKIMTSSFGSSSLMVEILPLKVNKCDVANSNSRLCTWCSFTTTNLLDLTKLHWHTLIKWKSTLHTIFFWFKIYHIFIKENACINILDNTLFFYYDIWWNSLPIWFLKVFLKDMLDMFNYRFCDLFDRLSFKSLILFKFNNLFLL